MTDLERIELALRKAMRAPNPHAKCEIYFQRFIEELTAMNNARRGSLKIRDQAHYDSLQEAGDEKKV